jgi:hypothetical protein
MENEEPQFTPALRKYLNTQLFYSVEEIIMLKRALINYNYNFSPTNEPFIKHINC